MISFILPLPGLPRRGDEDKRECTDTPIFLIQERRFVCTNIDNYGWDEDLGFYDGDGDEFTEEQIVDRGDGEWQWKTIRVAFTRREAQDFADAKKHWGVLRVYSVPCMGELRTILSALTDKETS